MIQEGPRSLPSMSSKRCLYYPTALVLSPTRELASQIHTESERVCLFVFLIIAIYGKVSILISSNPYPNYFGYTIFQVASGSMEPTLYKDDVILVKIGSNDYKKDDIISYLKDGSIITHRILYIDGDLLTVKGDNNNTIDTPINKNSIS